MHGMTPPTCKMASLVGAHCAPSPSARAVDAKAVVKMFNRMRKKVEKYLLGSPLLWITRRRRLLSGWRQAMFEKEEDSAQKVAQKLATRV